MITNLVIILLFLGYTVVITVAFTYFGMAVICFLASCYAWKRAKRDGMDEPAIQSGAKNQLMKF